MSGFTKLFGSILDSSIWQESKETRLVWITMLAMSNREGIVEAAIPGLADRAKVTVGECEAALNRFMQPDKWSRSQEFEGRRVEAVDGGWKLLNHQKYRQKLSADERRIYKAEKQAQYRQKKVRKRNTGNDGKPASAAFKARERRCIEAEQNGNQALADKIAAGEA